MSTRWSSRLKLSTSHSRFKQKQGLQLPRNQQPTHFFTVNPLESALPRSAPTTPAESTLTKPHESVSKQTTLTLAESALTSFSTSHSKQRTSSLIESALTRFVTLTPLESALTKKVGGGGGATRWYGPGGCLTEQTGRIPDTVIGWRARVERSACHGKRAVLWKRSFALYCSMTRVNTP